MVGFLGGKLALSAATTTVSKVSVPMDFQCALVLAKSHSTFRLVQATHPSVKLA